MEANVYGGQKSHSASSKDRSRRSLGVGNHGITGTGWDDKVRAGAEEVTCSCGRFAIAEDRSVEKS